MENRDRNKNNLNILVNQVHEGLGLPYIIKKLENYDFLEGFLHSGSKRIKCRFYFHDMFVKND